MATTQRIQQRECSTTSGSLFYFEDHGLVQYHRSASSFMPFSQDLSALSASKKEEESRSFDNVPYLAVDENAQAISRSSSLTFTLASGFYNRWLSVFGLSWIFLSIIMTALSALIYNPWILYFFPALFYRFTVILQVCTLHLSGSDDFLLGDWRSVYCPRVAASYVSTFYGLGALYVHFSKFLSLTSRSINT